MLKPAVLIWLYQTQKLLKEKFELDTAKPGDVGRIKLNQPYKESFDGHRNVLPYGTLMDEDCKVSNMYACAHRTEDDCEYEVQQPQNAEEEKEWQMEVQRTFRVVKNEDGTLKLDDSATTMSEEDLEKLYENAKDGRIYVNSPGVDILSANEGCAFLCVSKDDEPVLYDGGLKNFNVLPKEKQEHFLKNHPDIKIRKPGDPMGPGYYDSNDKELLEMAIKEETELASVENPDIVVNHAERGLTAVQNETTIGEKNTRYEVEFWYDVHRGLPTLSREEDTLLHRTMKDTLLEQVGVDSDFLLGQGLENFFVEKEDGTMAPLFPDHAQLAEQAENEQNYPYRTSSAVSERILNALGNGPLYVYGSNQNNPEKTCAAEMRLRKNGELRTYVVSEHDPIKPSWYKRLLNSINKNWYKDEMEQYRAEKAAHDEGMRHKENAAVAREELLNGEAARQQENSPQRQELRQKNAQAVKSRNFEKMMAHFKKNCLSQLSRQASEEEMLGGMGDTFGQLMFFNELENVVKNGTEDAKELLYQLSADGLAKIYNNVYLQAPDVKATLNAITSMTDEEGDGYTVNDYLGVRLSNALEEVGDDPEQYDPEDLHLADLTAVHLNEEKKAYAKSHKIKTIDLSKAFDLEAKKLKAEQTKKPAAKVKDKAKTTEKQKNVLGS